MFKKIVMVIQNVKEKIPKEQRRIYKETLVKGRRILVGKFKEIISRYPLFERQKQIGFYR